MQRLGQYSTDDLVHAPLFSFMLHWKEKTAPPWGLGVRYHDKGGVARLGPKSMGAPTAGGYEPRVPVC